ncbi:MAG: hypothetical protein IKZ56_08135 [Bacteroidales bacterium]|nr:hypothetical protein [Bacteroidales bacterium]
MNHRIRTLLAAVFFAAFELFFTTAMAQISPLDLGLRDATDGIDRYRILYNTHVQANSMGVEVSYAGIDTLDIELPPDFQTIPLGPHTDFGGLVLYVTNNARHGTLFSLNSPSEPVALDKALVDNGDFRSVPPLATGDKLLILNDLKPWTERIGYGYCIHRHDILLLHDGIAANAPIAPWNTDSTQLQAAVVNVDTKPKVFRGLNLFRTEQSQFKTYCLNVSGQCNVLIEDVHVTTPKSRMTADGVFGVTSSVGVTFRDVTVDGTYSGYGISRDYGYAFSLNNLWNTTFERVTADGNWGVFGTNYLSNTTLRDCDLNRFDIHCYGRDVLLQRCTLRQRQTQFSSMYGTVTFDSCRFIDCIPVRIRSSYNAYTPFDIVMRDCIFEVTPRYHSLVNVMLLDTATNSRPELAAKCWPNLRVTNMTVVAPATVGTLNLYYPSGATRELKKPVDYLDNVVVEGLKVVRPNGKPAKMNVRLSTREFITVKKMGFSIDGNPKL